MQRDTVLRWIEGISAIIARLLRRDPDVTAEMARRQVEDAKAMLLGPMEQLAPRLDPAQAAELLGDPHRIYGYAQLLALESALLRATQPGGDDVALARRALAFGREAARRLQPPPQEWLDWIDAAEADQAGRAGAAAPGPRDEAPGTPQPTE